MVTPNESQIGLAQTLGISELYFKREDLHPLGSHKGRSISKMIQSYLQEGFKHFAISSSGNAAKAAALYIQEFNGKNIEKLKLDIFVGKKINPEKLSVLKTLQSENIQIMEEDRPLQKLFQIVKNEKIKSLRQSKDDLALIGYEELALELLEIPFLKAVFIPTSSGTTAEALGKFFNRSGKKIQIHVIQTPFCNPIAEFFEGKTEKQDSIADAIVDVTAFRKEKVIEVVKQSSGFGWTVNNNEIKQAIEITEKTAKISLSPNSALAVAGLIKAIHKGWKWNGPVACLITGR